MEKKVLTIIASVFIVLAAAILAVLIFFEDYVDSIDAFLNKTEIITEVQTTEPLTEEPTTEKPTEPETHTTEPETVETTMGRPAYSGVDEKIVAFTFDDGPSVNVTPQILDTLERYGGRATFFSLGSLAAGKGEIFERMKSLGCQIGNHSYGHAYYSKMTSEEIKADVEKSQNAIYEVAGVFPDIFRVPYGEKSDSICSCIDLPVMLWSIDTLDWAKKDKSNVKRSEEERNRAIQDIFDGVINYVRPGDVVLMHDLYQITADSFEKIAQALTDDGWELVTVKELFEARGYELNNGTVYRNAR